ncbi:DUF4013 domain-containing protein [Halapricum salinum]|uniref:DUF4013 domain-containing protein n=1 Tax=Halapricum salinum TaxID=1457250 RepID=A0A4D6HEA7_9EURY|nr:DUF4013 domain-containing protein [Halapricum salinum]QCC52309.1 DUF4013 domain-containing protein [Halapricum salinum]
MIKEALRAPLAGERRWKRLAIGGGWLAVSFGIVPLWVVLGYVVQFAEAVAEDRSDVPPSFEYWGLLMSRGVRAFGISVVYLFVPAAFAIYGAFLYFIAPFNESFTTARAHEPLAIAAVLFAIAFYLLPAALLTYAIDGRTRAGFSPRQLVRFWVSWTYLRSWLLSVSLVVALHLCAIAVALTAIGVLAVPVVIFYSYLVGMYVLTTGTSSLLADIDTRTRPGRRT